ncbi:MAG TPA: polymorphic toxin type 46 domain-containing protein, partial [Azospirillaceae bacterium]|nr:polymorphic toxin type 46 domain-containing protein [Azospirillaceae bacterium]
YDANGMATRYADDAKGIDFAKPLEVIAFPAGTQWYQFVRDGSKHLGAFFSPSPQALPTCLGISGTGRTQVTAALPAGAGLQSVAAPIADTWTTPGVSVQTAGGCAQVVVNNDTKTRATFVK